jgi:hypothetical protein
MIGYEVKGCAARSLTQLIIDTWSVKIIGDGNTIAIKVPPYVCAVVNEFRRAACGARPLNSPCPNQVYLNDAWHPRSEINFDGLLRDRRGSQNNQRREGHRM